MAKSCGTVRYAYFRTLLGEIAAAKTKSGICALQFPTAGTRSAFLQQLGKWYPGAHLQQDTGGFKQLQHQLHQYLLGTSNSFQVQLDPSGTRFEKRVWDEVSRIPFGSTRSLEELGKRLGEEPPARHVLAEAVLDNRVAVIIPCHRVLNKHHGTSPHEYRRAMEHRLLMLESARQEVSSKHRRALPPEIYQ